MPTHLKLYRGPEQEKSLVVTKSDDGTKQITAPLAKLLPLLADAFNSQRTWLEDFEDDEVTVSADLYEVLLAYQYFRRPSA